MFVDGGWREPEEPPARQPRLSPHGERLFLWLVAMNALLLLLAPIGGATIIHAIIAAVWHRHG